MLSRNFYALQTPKAPLGRRWRPNQPASPVTPIARPLIYARSPPSAATARFERAAEMSGAVAKAGKEAARYTLRDGLKAAGKLAAFRDGNIAEQELNHGPGGVHVGTDANGNRFFENLDAQIGRHRWVVFAGHDWRNGGSSITPEWHGWMHAICDESPANAEFAKPVYALRAAANPTSTPG